jgi:hypothetical protein
MAVKATPSFDPKAFLGKVGKGRSIVKYRKHQTVFSQGEPADAGSYIQKARSRSRSFPRKARRLSSQFLVRMTSSARAVSPHNGDALRPSRR